LFDFLVDLDIENKDIRNPDILINFRDNLLKLNSQASDLSFVEFF